MNKEALKAGFSLQYSAKPNNRIFTVANIITFLGIVCVVLSAVNLHRDNSLGAFFFFLAVIASDFLDGFSARYIETKWPGYGISKVGEILDPLRDKSIVVILFFLNIWMAIAVIFFESIEIIAAARVRKKMGKHLIAVESKAITAVQFVLVGVFFFLPKDSFEEMLFACLIAVASLLRFFAYLRLLYK